MVRAKFFARTALALTLSLGVAAGGFGAAEAKDKKKAEAAKGPQQKLGEKFLKVAKPAMESLQASIKRPEMMAQREKVLAAEKAARDAKAGAAKDTAVAKLNAERATLQGMLTTEKGLIDAMVAAAVEPDEKLVAGQLLNQYGAISLDRTAQTNGLQMQIASGKLAGEAMGQAHFQLGMLASQAGNFKAAQTEMKAAIAAGYTKEEAEFQLSKAFMNDGQLPLGLKYLHDATVRNGVATPEYWIDDGVVQAFNNKLMPETNMLAVDLVTYYPSPQNWDRAFFTITSVNKYKSSDKIDLLRLRDRTGNMVQPDDYLDYMVYATSARLPAEVLSVIDKGIKSGKITLATDVATDVGMSTVAKVQAAAQAKMAEDNRLLTVQEADALGPKGTAVVALSAGDAFLSHGMAVKAEAMYRLAMTKPGVDASRANLRLGIVLYDRGKYADAIAAFAKVTDARAPIAQLWTVQAKQKLAGK